MIFEKFLTIKTKFGTIDTCQMQMLAKNDWGKKYTSKFNVIKGVKSIVKCFRFLWNLGKYETDFKSIYWQ